MESMFFTSLIFGLLTCLVNNRDCGNDDLEAEVTTTGGRILDDVHLVKSKDIHSITFNPKSAGVYRVKASIRGEVINGAVSIYLIFFTFRYFFYNYAC